MKMIVSSLVLVCFCVKASEVRDQPDEAQNTLTSQIEFKQCSDLTNFLESPGANLEQPLENFERLEQLVVSKKLRILWAFSQNKLVKTYPISLGANPQGPKSMVNDKKTPEGLYFIDFKNDESAFYRALHTSYPSPADQAKAALRGVDPGSDIMLHGFPLEPADRYEAQKRHMTSKDWTEGCIAVMDNEIEEIYSRVAEGTPLLICP